TGSGNLVSVGSDDRATIIEAVEYLATLGHRHIARVAGLPELLHTAVRTTAFTDICTHLGLEAAPTTPTDHTGAYGARAARHLLNVITGKPTTATKDDPAHLIPRGSTAPPTRPAPGGRGKP